MKTLDGKTLKKLFEKCIEEERKAIKKMKIKAFRFKELEYLYKISMTNKVYEKICGTYELEYHELEAKELVQD